MGTLGYMLLLIAAFSVIIILHMVEIAIWGCSTMRSLFPDFETSFTSRSPATRPWDLATSCCRAWRMLGGMEGDRRAALWIIDGVCLTDLKRNGSNPRATTNQYQ